MTLYNKRSFESYSHANTIKNYSLLSLLYTTQRNL